jgi:hypothetical protein
MLEFALAKLRANYLNAIESGTQMGMRTALVADVRRTLQYKRGENRRQGLGKRGRDVSRI